MRQYVWDQEIISGENFLSPVQRWGVIWQNCTFSLLYLFAVFTPQELLMEETKRSKP